MRTTNSVCNIVSSIPIKSHFQTILTLAAFSASTRKWFKHLLQFLHWMKNVSFVYTRWRKHSGNIIDTECYHIPEWIRKILVPILWWNGTREGRTGAGAAIMSKNDSSADQSRPVALTERGEKRSCNSSFPDRTMHETLLHRRFSYSTFARRKSAWK